MSVISRLLQKNHVGTRIRRHTKFVQIIKIPGSCSPYLFFMKVDSPWKIACVD
jgi:hypothetical protein